MAKACYTAIKGAGTDDQVLINIWNDLNNFEM